MNLTKVAGKRLVISALFPLVEQELSKVKSCLERFCVVIKDE